MWEDPCPPPTLGISLKVIQSLELKHFGNKAGYTATPVACGWAGAVLELLEHLGRSSEAKDRKNIKKVKWGPTDQPTD